MDFNEYRVIITEPAKADIIGIHSYIAKDLNAPAAAKNLVLAIRKSTRTLTFSPQGLPRVPDDRLSAKGYRWIGIKNYMAFFTIDEQAKAVYVERILYGQRDWTRIL